MGQLIGAADWRLGAVLWPADRQHGVMGCAVTGRLQGFFFCRDAMCARSLLWCYSSAAVVGGWTGWHDSSHGDASPPCSHPHMSSSCLDAAAQADAMCVPHILIPGLPKQSSRSNHHPHQQQQQKQVLVVRAAMLTATSWPMILMLRQQIMSGAHAQQSSSRRDPAHR